MKFGDTWIPAGDARLGRAISSIRRHYENAGIRIIERGEANLDSIHY